MKNVESTLKKWSSKLHNSKLESQWEQWQSLKEHSLEEFMALINSNADDFFKMRAFLFLIIPGYWRKGFDSNKKYIPEYSDDFFIDCSKLSDEVISFSVEILTAVLMEIHMYFKESLPDPSIISIDEDDKDVEALRRTKNSIRKLKIRDEKYYPGEYYYFGRPSFAIYNSLAVYFLNYLSEERGKPLFDNLFFARQPLILFELYEPLYINYVGREIEMFIEKANRITWIKELGRFLFSMSLKEVNFKKRDRLLSLYIKKVLGLTMYNENICEKEREDFIAEEISFILDNTDMDLWRKSSAFNFGFRNFHLGNNYDPISTIVAMLARCNESLATRLLQRMMIEKLCLTDDSVGPAETIVECIHDQTIKDFFSDLLAYYYKGKKDIEVYKTQQRTKKQKQQNVLIQNNAKSQELLSSMMNSPKHK